MATRPAIFKWRQTDPVLILCAVRWYSRYSLSLRDVEELLQERGLQADHTTVWRWVQRYAPELEQRLGPLTNLGACMRPTFECWAAGANCIGRSSGDDVLGQVVSSGSSSIWQSDHELDVVPQV